MTDNWIYRGANADPVVIFSYIIVWYYILWGDGDEGGDSLPNNRKKIVIFSLISGDPLYIPYSII